MAKETSMPETAYQFTEGERAFLVELLQRTLKDARTEEHRTRTPSYRETVLRQEDAITAILNKLGQPAK
jgi:hypothetical protein